MAFLIIVRHGQSQWNLENRFTGEADVDLTPQGEEEAKMAGAALKSFTIDRGYTSVLKRSIRTMEIIQEQIAPAVFPVRRAAALNERNYGKLQGLNKTETEQQYGAGQVLEWRRSFDIAPPGGESLKDTYDRVLPFYQREIEPELKAGENILIVAHGNSLRALMMYLEHISKEAIVNLNLATGAPRVYELSDSLTVAKAYYLI
jgi:2,3-bisphosphoglycerate-dependent phosphoglycerate mutase